MINFKGVTFAEYHSFRDFSLVLSKKTIETPAVKTSSVEIEGMDGILDLTDYFGEPKYKNRKLKFEFSTLGVERKDFDSLFSNIQNAIHGQFVKIIVDDDDAFYYMGRVNVNEWKSDKTIGKVVIECDCEPFKYKKYVTVITEDIVGTREFVLTNLRKSVVPVFKSTGTLTIKFENQIYSIDSGEYTLDDVVLKQGKNLLTVEGNATLTIEYQERGL
ncbi:hypothetical protein A9CBEGH2_07810 [Amedibacterium intestinale]|uniref:hypothetical protein n=1 Tax=Amedibacterium intestinale TaxID=2583452 RepID=UPI001373EF5E|nr:hypothetical protein [Amedibacterium intestinale]BBK61841.1 hypothetical protein A9CBEGH2_07810 [Amedibacterium intestinale]